MPKLSFICLSFLLLNACGKAQHLNIPPIACPNYFQYFFDNYQHIGKIAIPTVSNSIQLTVDLSQRQPIHTNYYGEITLESRDPIIYRIEFPSPTEVPKLTRIVVNGKEICAQNEYPAPMTHVSLTHTFSTQPLASNLPEIFIEDYSTDTKQFEQFPVPSIQTQPTRIGTPFTQTSNNRPTINRDSQEKGAQFFQTPNNRPTVDRGSQPAAQPARQNIQCGQGNAVTTPLIFGGQEVMQGEFPWLTAVYVKSAGLRFLCGGSLVSARAVISAGHCFKIRSLTASRLVVHLGRHNLEDFSELGFITREIENLLVHPEYNESLYPDADLAILQLKQSVQFAKHIRPICLWTSNSELSFIEGEAGMVAGWGADEQGRSFTPTPKKVDAKIVSDTECWSSSITYKSLTTPRTFCAGNRDDTGPCMGDSGSGLILNREGRWYLRGVVSVGQTKARKCNLQEFVVFCDVAKHLQWVQSNLVV